MLELQPEGPLIKYLLRIFKKLVSVSTTSASMIEADKEDKIILERVSCVYYPLCFRKDKKNKV